MTVTITMSNHSGGDQVEEVVDLGNKDPGNASPLTDLFIRHDAINNPITNCGFYIIRYAGSDYTGIANPDSDYNEVISWGDHTGDGTGLGAGGTEDEGGLFMNQNHLGRNPGDATEDDPYGKFKDGSWKAFNSNRGPGYNMPWILSSDAINIKPVGYTPVAGEIPQNGEAHVQMRWDVPSTVETAGARFIQLVMAYSYTS